MVSPIQSLIARPPPPVGNAASDVAGLLGAVNQFRQTNTRRQALDQQQQQYEDEQARAEELREIQDGARDALIAHSIRDPDKRQSFLARRAAALEKQGRDSSHTREIMQLPFEQQDAELLRNGAVLIDNYPGGEKALLAAMGIDDGFTLSEGQKRFGSEGELIAENLKTPDDEDVQKRVDKLRTRYDKFTEDFRDVDAAFRKVKKAPDTAFGDMSRIFGFMKLIDPGSTVREGEFATAEGNAGIPTRILNLYNRARSGERLSEDQRAEIQQTAEQLYESQSRSADQFVADLLSQADQDGVSREKVLGEKALREFEKRAAARLIEQNKAAEQADGVTVQTPDGPITFPNEQAANQFKQAAGIQ